MVHSELPAECQPLSPWAYFGYEILYAVPLIGWIFLIIHAIGAFNVNKRNFARSYFVIYVVVILAVLVCSLLGVTRDVFGSGVRA